jgi:hypothetical protein
MTDLTVQPNGKWQQFKAWLHGFELYQIFVVRAWRRQTSRGWYVLMLVPSLLVYFNLCMWLQHAATLDEMRKDAGMVESFTIGRNCAASLMLRTDDGALRHYSFCERDETRPQRVIGKRATVWSEGGLIPPFVWDRNLMQLQVGTTFEGKFDPQWPVVVNHGYEKIIKFFLPFVLIPLFRIWWVNRKAKPDQQG